MAKKPPTVKAGSAKKVSDTEVVVNLKGIEGRRRRRTHIPAGNYLAKVAEATTFTAKSGNPGVTWVFEIADGKYAGQRFWYRTMLISESLWSFRGVLEALKPPVKIKDSAMRIPLDRLAGRTCGIEITDGEYQGKVVSEVNDIFPESQLEDEEEEYDDDEEEEEDEDEDHLEGEEEDLETEDEEEEDWEDEEEDEDEEIDLDEDEL